MTSKSFPTILANVVVVFLGISAIYLLREYQPEVRPVKRATVDLSDNKDISVELNNIVFAILSFAILSVGAYLIINTM